MAATAPIEPRMHDSVRLIREVDSVPAGAIGWVVQVFGDGFLGVELEDPELSSRVDGIVDVAREDIEILGRSR